VRLSDLLSADRIVVPLEETILPAAAGPLVERLVAMGAVSRPEVLRDRLAEERPEDIVAWSDRAFLLHYRTEAVRELAVALGVAPSAVRRDIGGGEEQRARVVLLVVAPPRMAGRYLQVVGAFARLLSRDDVVAELVAAASPDAAAALPAFAGYELTEQLTVREIMTERPRTVKAEVPLRDAASEMVRARVGGLLVTDDEERLVGVLSERELLRHLLSVFLLGGTERPRTGGGESRRSVRDVMTRQVLCVSPEQPLAEVASLLANKDVDRVPVVRDGRLVGVLTRGDIVRKLIGY
jgi:CBS domain-containing protein/mannitol/fructose-specific phosphotransferase system IIA component (Ntr-type)